MSTTQRRLQPSVVDRLTDEPYRFEFFQAVRVIEMWLKFQDPTHSQTVAECVRFENSISLSFPPSEIESFRVEKRPDDLYADLPNTLDIPLEFEGEVNPFIERFFMTPSFIGFLGPNGTLPRHYSERIVSHQLYKRDQGPRAFLDTYSNRAVALFFGAWKKYRLELDHEVKGKNGFLPLLMSLSGMGYPSLRNRLNSDDVAVSDESLAFYASAMRQRPMSSVYLQTVLSDYFNVDIKIQQFVGKWYVLPKAHQSVLGVANAELGTSALSGQRVWQRDLRIALKIGPLRKKDFNRFLPRQIASRALEQMLKILVGLTLEFEIQLILHADDVTGCDLQEHRNGGLLGWDTFLATKRQRADRTDVRYTLNSA